MKQPCLNSNLESAFNLEKCHVLTLFELLNQISIVLDMGDGNEKEI